ncbi:MAG TPA: glycosyltransferase family 9 protein [Segetibacter sp.]|nr:glycosyltransferase family 9 protein [Segetibacter sp.]
MTKSWLHCKNILIIRADNMGDLIMSSPAIRALKETFSAKITVLTSSMAAGIVPAISEIDEVIVFDLPWVKAKETIASEAIFTLVQQLKQKRFDAVVIFTVFSQNPLPAAMIAYMAAIPLRLAYCRENPYDLLTNWVPDQEPYTFIQHQVLRDLRLVETIGATTKDNRLHLNVPETISAAVNDQLKYKGVNVAKPWCIFHAGVSEKKREYPFGNWVEAARKLIDEKGFQILFTGAPAEKEMCDKLAEAVGENAFSVAGLFSLQEFIALIKNAPIIVSVNTGSVHIAAAVNTPVVVLYAQTNPQHTPWMVPNRVLEYKVDTDSQSKNEVIQYLYKTVYNQPSGMPGPNEIFAAVVALLQETAR